MSNLIYAHNNERTDLGEFTADKVADLIWDRAYAEAYPDDYLRDWGYVQQAATIAAVSHDHALRRLVRAAGSLLQTDDASGCGPYLTTVDAAALEELRTAWHALPEEFFPSH